MNRYKIYFSLMTEITVGLLIGDNLEYAAVSSSVSFNSLRRCNCKRHRPSCDPAPVGAHEDVCLLLAQFCIHFFFLFCFGRNLVLLCWIYFKSTIWDHLKERVNKCEWWLSFRWCLSPKSFQRQLPVVSSQWHGSCYPPEHVSVMSVCVRLVTASFVV